MSFIIESKNKVNIVHELPCRLRIRCDALSNPSLDFAYMEAILLNVSGVEKVRINCKGCCVVVNYDGEPQNKEKILLSLENIPIEAYESLSRKKTIDSINVISRGLFAFLTPVFPNQLKAPLSWCMSLPVMFEGMEKLFTEGVKVEVLDGSAVGFSLLRKDYFAANTIVALITLGEYLEQLSEEKTTDLLKSLLRPQVETVWVERDGHEIQIKLDKVLIGDFVLCGPGEMISIDGVVVNGDASVNRSSITGESVPVHVQPEDEVLSGSVIEEGRIKIMAKHVGTETSMARINRFLENSLRFKSVAQKKSDELADKLVPITFALGLATYLFTRDIRRAASVLSVDYSCAIKLANPIAVKMCMYTAAHSGVLLKGSQALDSMARVDTIVFDKTGTLTKGVLEVTDIISLGDISSEELLSIAAGAEEHYTHPVANAVVNAAKERDLKLPAIGQVDFIVAHGVSAYVDDKRVLVGSRHFIEEDEGIDCPQADDFIKKLHKEGKSILFVAREKVLEGIIGLRDELRPEAPAVLQELKNQGIQKIVVLTGDHRDTARAVAGRLKAVDDIHWELKPEDKADIINNLKAQGHFLAFAGDGVNDAPALVTADVGICMPGGADLARESAQVVLLKDDLNALVIARKIARSANQTIENCFKSSVGLNSAFLFLASIGKLSPVNAAILHNTTTIGILSYAALAGLKTEI
ncbi:manganese/zinc-transporting P-type ATPase C [Candidatus Magnetomoraceae bacterium gMMP-15]